jgi:hypothetical protein
MKTYYRLLLAGAPLVGLNFMTTDVIAAPSAHNQLRHLATHHFARAEVVYRSAAGTPVYNRVGPLAPSYGEPSRSPASCSTIAAPPGCSSPTN